MSFLSPWMLYGLCGIAAPIVIHLWRRRRMVQVRFGTLRFLKIAAARTSRSSRIENLLLLLLRCLIFALVALALARPAAKPGMARIPGTDVPGTVVLVVDNSLSMSYRTGSQTRLDEAKAEALAVIERLKPGDRVAVLASNAHSEPLVPEPTVDHAVARTAILAARQTEERTDFAPALREAVKIAAHAERGIRQIYLFTDNQESGWHFDPGSVFDAVWRGAETSLTVVRTDELDSPNATVSQVKMQTPFLTAGAVARGLATVRNFSSAPLHDVMEVRLEGNRVAQKPVDLGPGGSEDVPFDFAAPAVAARSARGVARLSGDNLPGDDQYFFTVPVYQPPRVIVAEGQQLGPEREHSGYYLIKALGAGGDKLASVRTIAATALDDTEVADCSAIFLADPGQISDRAAVRLERFLDGGGTVAIFPGERPTNFWRLDYSPVTQTAVRELPSGRLPGKIAEPSDPIFVNAWDADTPFPALPQTRMLDLKPAVDAKALVTVGPGWPFVIARDHGAGRVILVNASADRAWGDFPLSPAFLPLVQQIARLSGARGETARALTVGEAITGAPNLPRNEPLNLAWPDGSAHDIAAGAQPALLEHAEESGFYEARGGRESALYAVNVDRRESDLKPIDPAALDRIVPHETVAGLENLKFRLAQGRGLVPLWPGLLLLALAAYAAEAVLANTMAGKRSQGETAHIATGRLNKRRAGTPFRAGIAGGGA